MKKLFAIILGISVLANVFLGLMYMGQRTMVIHAKEQNENAQKKINQIKKESNKKEKTLTTFKQNEAYNAIENNVEIKSFVADTFRKLFNYDNKNYAERFDQVRNNLAESVISKLQASGEMGSPQIEFKNEVKALTVYLSAVGNDQVKALVNMETQYSVGGSEFPRKNQMYEITLLKNQEKWIVDKLELLGSFEPFDEN